MDYAKLVQFANQPKSWRQFDPELREMAQALLLADNLGTEDVYARLDEIKEGLGEDDARRIDRLFTGYVTDGLTASMKEGDGANAEQKALIRKSLQAGLLCQALRLEPVLLKLLMDPQRRKS